MIVNKKIRGASIIEFDNIKFRSILEKSCYKKLMLSSLNFTYESEKIVLWEGIKLDKTIFYAPKKIGNGKYSKLIEKQERALVNITYTPDFIVTFGNYKIYFDVKGKENDTYPIKKKMFLKVLENRSDGLCYMFFEPHSVGQLLQAIEIIKNIKNESDKKNREFFTISS